MTYTRYNLNNNKKTMQRTAGNGNGKKARPLLLITRVVTCDGIYT